MLKFLSNGISNMEKSMTTFNHPKKGSTITVHPITDIKAIKRIKTLIQDHPRNFALFVTGINMAFRAGDLLSIKAKHVRDLNVGDDLVLKEEKTGKLRRVTINESTFAALRTLLLSRTFEDEEYIFTGQRGNLCVGTVNRMVKGWCNDVGLKGNYGSHSLRKTWGYHQRVTFKSDLMVLTEAFNHSSQRQTLQYLCIQSEEKKSVYMNAL
jgi:integrase